MKTNIQFSQSYLSKLLGHLGSPHKMKEPEQAITSEATTKIEAIESKIVLEKDKLFFIIPTPFLVLVEMLVQL